MRRGMKPLLLLHDLDWENDVYLFIRFNGLYIWVELHLYVYT